MSITPPKPNFRPVQEVRWARFTSKPPFVVRPQRRGRKAQGIRYEHKVQGCLSERFPEKYLPSPWIVFDDGDCERVRYCQPDGLIIDLERGRVTIVEIKLQHTPHAWWQLRWLYLPVVRALFAADHLWQYEVVEVVRWYDPAISFPEPVALCADVDNVPAGKFGVHICSG